MLDKPKAAEPFKIDRVARDPVRRTLLNLLASPLERTLGLATLNAIYAQVHHDPRDDFLEKALDHLGIRYAVSSEDMGRIPKSGSCVVVSNHPFGGLDGIVLAAILRRVRPDTKVMANYLLGRIPELREFMIFVDPFGSKQAVQRNRLAMKAALAHLSGGHLLLVFPAGEVSHIDLAKRAVLDGPWADHVARLVRKTGSAVLPVFFSGCNSAFFNVMGLIHPLLRTALLPREFLNKQNQSIGVEIGASIPFSRLADFSTDAALTAYLRLRTYLLQSRGQVRRVSGGKGSRGFFLRRGGVAMEPIAEARDSALLAAEVGGLPAEALLLEHGDLRVYAARAPQIPQVLREIGRLREITFRSVSEGTGKALDLDRFDEDYVHLFLYCPARSEVVGAYRLGLTDEILPKKGLEGLYTSTLFTYQPGVVEKLGPALELGRSFICPEYQKSYAPLLLLWKGIGAFVVRYPRYQVFFGPVSINANYRSLSRQLIMNFLEANNSLPAMAGGIRPKNPPQVRPDPGVDVKECSTVVRDIDEVSDMVAEIESDHKGIPILLKQYLKMGAKILGFNIDPDFGDVLDGLVLVDLRHTDPRLIERFAGAEGAKVVLGYQKNAK